jgi:bifunctional DNA-binding transcriptional regulator/antitoxin component of YhaV-PrlF toxin-antitoxin module
LSTKFTIEFKDEKTGRIFIPQAVRKNEKLKAGDIIEVSIENLNK